MTSTINDKFHMQHLPPYHWPSALLRGWFLDLCLWSDLVLLRSRPWNSPRPNKACKGSWPLGVHFHPTATTTTSNIPSPGKYQKNVYVKYLLLQYRKKSIITHSHNCKHDLCLACVACQIERKDISNSVFHYRLFSPYFLIHIQKSIKSG